MWTFFNEEEKEHRDQIELIDQYIANEKGSNSPDDGPDAGHGGIDELNRSAFIEKFEPKISTRSKSGKNRY